MNKRVIAKARHTSSMYGIKKGKLYEGEVYTKTAVSYTGNILKVHRLNIKGLDMALFENSWNYYFFIVNPYINPRTKTI